jgi:hypothetical protein
MTITGVVSIECVDDVTFVTLKNHDTVVLDSGCVWYLNAFVNKQGLFSVDVEFMDEKEGC